MQPNSLTKGMPSLSDYTAFHGMLCRPDAARRCLESFQNGVVLFADQQIYDSINEENAPISDSDFGISPFPLNVWTYYLLVLASLTGFCSVMRRTRVVQAIKYDNNNESGDKPLRFRKGDLTTIVSATRIPLRLPPEALEYVIDRSIDLGPVSPRTATTERTETNGKPISGEAQTIPEITLVRRFEYDFGNTLSVMMLHFACTNGRMHLVEIYTVNKKSAAGFLANLFIQPLYYVKYKLIQWKHRGLKERRER